MMGLYKVSFQLCGGIIFCVHALNDIKGVEQLYL